MILYPYSNYTHFQYIIKSFAQNYGECWLKNAQNYGEYPKKSQGLHPVAGQTLVEKRAVRGSLSAV